MRNHDRNMVRHRRRRWNCRDVNTVVARGATRKSIKRKRPPKNRKNARRRPGAVVAEPTRFSISFEIDRIEALLKKREIVMRGARNASRHFRAVSTGGKIRGFILLRNGNGLPMLNNTDSTTDYHREVKQSCAPERYWNLERASVSDSAGKCRLPSTSIIAPLSLREKVFSSKSHFAKVHICITATLLPMIRIIKLTGWKI